VGQIRLAALKESARSRGIAVLLGGIRFEPEVVNRAPDAAKRLSGARPARPNLRAASKRANHVDIRLPASESLLLKTKAAMDGLWREQAKIPLGEPALNPMNAACNAYRAEVCPAVLLRARNERLASPWRSADLPLHLIDGDASASPLRHLRLAATAMGHPGVTAEVRPVDAQPACA